MDQYRNVGGLLVFEAMTPHIQRLVACAVVGIGCAMIFIAPSNHYHKPVHIIIIIIIIIIIDIESSSSSSSSSSNHRIIESSSNHHHHHHHHHHRIIIIIIIIIIESSSNHHRIIIESSSSSNHHHHHRIIIIIIIIIIITTTTIIGAISSLSLLNHAMSPKMNTRNIKKHVSPPILYDAMELAQSQNSPMPKPFWYKNNSCGEMWCTCIPCKNHQVTQLHQRDIYRRY